MYSFEPKDLPQPKVHGFLIGGVAPRPIALVSTISKDGVNNLAPFSFYNAFGSNPPIVAFSPARRGTDGSLKDTYSNLVDNGECVINAVTYGIVEQVNLASTEYTSDIDEFIKSGFTPIDSDIVRPKRVKESPYHLECRLIETKSYGNGGGAANIAICEVVKFHVDESIMADGYLVPHLVDSIGRNGSNYWTRAQGESLFQLNKPQGKTNIGYDGLPERIKQSVVFTANNLARFAMQPKLPTESEVFEFINTYEPIERDENRFYIHLESGDYERCLQIALHYCKKVNPASCKFLELTAKGFLQNDDIETALKIAVFCSLQKTI